MQIQRTVQAANSWLSAQPVNAFDALARATGRTAPDVKWSPPVSLSRKSPVNVVLQPVAKTAVFYVLGEPVDLPIAGDEFILHSCGSDVPRRLGKVEQRSLASPAERVGVDDSIASIEKATLFNVLQNRSISILDEPSRKGIAADHPAIQVYRLNEVQSAAHADIEVNLSEGRGNMHHTRTFIKRDEVGSDNRIVQVIPRLLCA